MQTLVPRSEVYEAIDSERDYQDMRVIRDHGAGAHELDAWLLYIIEYVEQARRVASTTWGPDATPKTLEAIRKVAGLCVAAMEEHGAPKRNLETALYQKRLEERSKEFAKVKEKSKRT